MKTIVSAALIAWATAAVLAVNVPVHAAVPVTAAVPVMAGASMAAANQPQNAAPANPLAGLPAVGAKNPHGCLASGDGFLRVRIRGALVLDVSLHNAELECDGGPRPDGSGIRVSFAGPARSDGRRLRMVFGVARATEGVLGRELPTNLTVIFEGEQRMFATRGDDKCTVDEFKQERVGAFGGHTRNYRVSARGFCIAPVKALSTEESILVNSFDFAGSITFEDEQAPAPTPAPARQQH
jgi:hypothetical protein